MPVRLKRKFKMISSEFLLKHEKERFQVLWVPIKDPVSSYEVEILRLSEPVMFFGKFETNRRPSISASITLIMDNVQHETDIQV